MIMTVGVKNDCTKEGLNSIAPPIFFFFFVKGYKTL